MALREAGFIPCDYEIEFIDRMPIHKPSKPPKVSLHWVPSFTADLYAIYEELGEDAADSVRAELIGALRKLKDYEWDESLIQNYGIVGDTFAFDFCRNSLLSKTGF